MKATQTAETKNNHAKDLNINERIRKFKEQLKNEHVYRIPLRCFTDLGKINFPTKIDYRFKLYLETEMKRLFESRKVLTSRATLPTPDAKIIFTKAPYNQYELILFNKNFRQYFGKKNGIKKNTKNGNSKNTYTKILHYKYWPRYFRY